MFIYVFSTKFYRFFVGDDVPDFEGVSEENLAAKMEEYETDRLNVMTNHPVFQPRFKDIIDDVIAAGILV